MISRRTRASATLLPLWVFVILTLVLSLANNAITAECEPTSYGREITGRRPQAIPESERAFVASHNGDQTVLCKTDDEQKCPSIDDGNGFTSFPGSYGAFLEALETMQSHFFEIWVGTWPSAIDWTAAVMGTHISKSLEAITLEADWETLSSTLNATGEDNLINRYFTQLVSFYFGENALALRIQAYDDMLWVVLDWLEAIKFINLHSSLRYGAGTNDTSKWYATQFIPAFAHRARIFYELASAGWDTTLCGGGMIWNPHLAPYKNAITNELFIAASVNMYLIFPGDDNDSPFVDNGVDAPADARDPKYLEAAVEAYRWLSTSNMTNSKGLYVDGFHIHGFRGDGPDKGIGTGRCDVRNEKVYTYNQGVLLTGLRGLWQATGNASYLEDGHALIRNVIAATGWHVKDGEERRKWAGIGRNGILEEACDANATCNQNGQTFKGVFFLHLTTFCEPLPPKINDTALSSADSDLDQLHRQSCRKYAAWVKHNALAAYGTRNENGEFGMWWTWGLGRKSDALEKFDDQAPLEGIDYRNGDVPMDEMWQIDPSKASMPRGRDGVHEEHQHMLPHAGYRSDPNNRGRGRTVETQSGGLAVLRAMHRLVHRADRGGT